MCTIDFEDELGDASRGNRVYPSVEALKRYHTCWRSCGISEVEVRFVREVTPQNLWDGASSASTTEPDAVPGAAGDRRAKPITTPDATDGETP